MVVLMLHLLKRMSIQERIITMLHQLGHEKYTQLQVNTREILIQCVIFAKQKLTKAETVRVLTGSEQNPVYF